MAPGLFAAVDSEPGKHEHDPFLAKLEASSSDHLPLKNRSRSSWRTILTVTPWFISACLGVWVLILQVELKNRAAVFGSYESGFDTDISTYNAKLHVRVFRD